MKDCKHTEDGYCIREENDYCPADACISPPFLETVLGMICNHKETSIVVLESVVTCETTVVKCDTCKKILTEPKIDC